VYLLRHRREGGPAAVQALRRAGLDVRIRGWDASWWPGTDHRHRGVDQVEKGPGGQWPARPGGAPTFRASREWGSTSARSPKRGWCGRWASAWTTSRSSSRHRARWPCWQRTWVFSPGRVSALVGGAHLIPRRRWWRARKPG